MPVSAEQFKEALSKLPGGEDLLEFHAGAVASEKERGISAHREVNKEAQKLRKFKQAFEVMGYDPNSQVDIDAFASEMMDKIDKTKASATTEIGELQKVLKKLQSDFTTAQTELKTERETRTSLEKQNRLKTIESKLLPKLKEEYYGAEFMVKALLADGAVDLDEAGEVVFRKGEAIIPFTDGMKGLAESNADARRNKQAGGAGSSSSTQAKAPKFTMEQIKAMDHATMKANLQDVNASMQALSVK